MGLEIAEIMMDIEERFMFRTDDGDPFNKDPTVSEFCEKLFQMYSIRRLQQIQKIRAMREKYGDVPLDHKLGKELSSFCSNVRVGLFGKIRAPGKTLGELLAYHEEAVPVDFPAFTEAVTKIIQRRACLSQAPNPEDKLIADLNLG